MIWDMGSKIFLVCLATKPRQTPAVHPGWHLLVIHPRPARQAPRVPAITHTLKFSEILGRAYLRLGRNLSQRARQAKVRLAPWPPKAWISIDACLLVLAYNRAHLTGSMIHARCSGQIDAPRGGI